MKNLNCDTKRYRLSEDLAHKYLSEVGALDAIENFGMRSGNRIPAQLSDLARLHMIVTDFRVANSWEFGVGFSTVVISHALDFNRRNLGKGYSAGLHYSIDDQSKWIERAKEAMPRGLLSYCRFVHSLVEVKTFRGRLCHSYQTLPTILPDFIYVDGPDPLGVDTSDEQCQGTYGIPMVANVNTIENFLLPSTVVLFDGRTLNARFFSQEIERNWHIEEVLSCDYTLCVLDELPIGARNQLELTTRKLLKE